MSEIKEKKFKFNIIDAIVLLVVILVAVFVVSNVFGGTGSENGTNGAQEAKTQKYIMSYFFEEVPDFAVEMIDKGTVVSDEACSHKIGKLLTVETGDSITFIGTDDGKIVKGSKEGYKSVSMTIEAEGKPFDHGIEINKAKYVVGHTMVVYAGKAKLYGRISGIEKK